VKAGSSTLVWKQNPNANLFSDYFECFKSGRAQRDVGRHQPTGNRCAPDVFRVPVGSLRSRVSDVHTFWAASREKQIHWPGENAVGRLLRSAGTSC